MPVPKAPEERPAYSNETLPKESRGSPKNQLRHCFYGEPRENRFVLVTICRPLLRSFGTAASRGDSVGMRHDGSYGGQAHSKSWRNLQVPLVSESAICKLTVTLLQRRQDPVKPICSRSWI